jgi:hypothetical protein
VNEQCSRHKWRRENDDTSSRDRYEKRFRTHSSNALIRCAFSNYLC